MEAPPRDESDADEEGQKSSCYRSKVKPEGKENSELIDLFEGAFQAESRVKIKGYAQRPELNGQVAEVVERISNDGTEDGADQFEVRLSDGLTKEVLDAKYLEKEEWEVRVRCTISRVIDICLMDQNFGAELHLEVSWIEEKLANKNRQAEGPPTASPGAASAEPLRFAAGDVEITAAQLNSSSVAEQSTRFEVDEEKSSMEKGFFQIGKERYDAPRVHFRNCIERKRSDEWWVIYSATDIAGKSTPIV